MPKTNHRAKLQAAYQKSPPHIRKIIAQKGLSGSYQPDEIIDTLLALQAYGKKVKGNENALKSGIKKNTERRVSHILPVIIIASVVLGVISLIFDETRWYILMAVMAIALGTLVWVSISWFRTIMGQRYHIHGQSLSFALHLVALLKDEIRPGSKLTITLGLDSPKRRKYHFKTDKNYLFFWHRVIISGFWLLVLTSLSWLIFELFVRNNEVSEILFAFVLPFMPIIIILYLPILMIAAAAFGKHDKIKTRLYRCPQLLVKASLADGTLFQVEVATLLALRRVHKKKFKAKNFQITKVKRKHKVKTLTTLKLAFPLKKYQMTEESFKENFDRNWRIRNQKVAKVKLKSGDKRKTVVYQDAQTGQGQGYKDISYPSPNFKRFLELVTRSGFRALHKSVYKKEPVGQIKIGNDGEEQIGDDLTKIKGIIKTTQEELHRVGIITYRQLADLDKKGIRDIVQELVVPYWQVERWQVAAQEMVVGLSDFSDDEPAQDDLAKINGIGRSTADKLNSRGIFSYQQIVEMTEDDFADILQRIGSFPKKASDWQNQAQKLMNKKIRQK
ncbi:hypothetical protein BKI52_01240 [marine bacterium AO1-C]|nr:hypothetical protein BKI52_01240 [marine bacterium AO1-C]